MTENTVEQKTEADRRTNLVDSAKHRLEWISRYRLRGREVFVR